GQHDQQQLFSPQVQCEMLDAFAGADIAEVCELFRSWKRASAELDELERGSQEKLRLADLWSFQRNEIEAVDPKPGEDADLENERCILRNVVKLQELAGGAYQGLYEDPDSVSAQLSLVLKRLEELARIDQEAHGLLAQLDSARIAIQEASYALGHYV